MTTKLTRTYTDCLPRKEFERESAFDKVRITNFMGNIPCLEGVLFGFAANDKFFMSESQGLAQKRNSRADDGNLAITIYS